MLMIDPQTRREPHRRSGVSLSALFVDEHVARAAVSIPPEKHKGFAPMLPKYRDRVTSLYQSDRGRRHGRNENEKKPWCHKGNQGFSIVGVKGFEPSTLWSQSNPYRTQKTRNSSVIH
jgi:hypothetical protein